ncbi:somatomedin-B and thrombospondin type-1 domain-containing protein isoform X2 [Nasonia vitripennis]|uniref:Spondin-like TSP1 domain-containing protein n=1 Tax=Nasonia vitripennis TaxID=7425 RepID=A0A7M7Q505_NASVI|nr:somatomedin-B and thrombospondin type-1 domain-containing protein isoform X2 [Nasonia vitripennis]
MMKDSLSTQSNNSQHLISLKILSRIGIPRLHQNMNQNQRTDGRKTQEADCRIVTDCSVSEWSEWSECDNMCGLGLQTRRRHVVRAERNGGKACPTSLEQTLTCQNYGSCRRRARHFQVEELGPEAAANLSSFTTDSSEATLDSNFVPQITRGYCTAFTILKISRGCRRKMESFHEGSRVCVWCREANPTRSISSCQLDSPSFSGIGRWELMNSLDGLKHCHGKWIAASLECGEEVCKGRPKLGLL